MLLNHLPYEFALLNDKMTDWKANAVEKSQRGRGKACSRYTTSAPDREGK